MKRKSQLTVSVFTWISCSVAFASTCPHENVLQRYEDILESELPIADERGLSAEEGGRWLARMFRDAMFDGTAKALLPHYSPHYHTLYSTSGNLTSADPRAQAQGGIDLLFNYAWKLIPPDLMQPVVNDFMYGLSPGSGRTHGEYQDSSYRRQARSALESQSGCEPTLQDFDSIEPYEPENPHSPDVPPACQLIPFDDFLAPAVDTSGIFGIEDYYDEIVSTWCAQSGETHTEHEIPFYLNVFVEVYSFPSQASAEDAWRNLWDLPPDEVRDLLHEGTHLSPVFSKYTNSVTEENGRRHSVSAAYLGHQNIIGITLHDFSDHSVMPPAEAEVLFARKIHHVRNAFHGASRNSSTKDANTTSLSNTSFGSHSVPALEGCLESQIVSDYVHARDNIIPEYDNWSVEFRVQIASKLDALADELESRVTADANAEVPRPELNNSTSIEHLILGNDWETAIGFASDIFYSRISASDWTEYANFFRSGARAAAGRSAETLGMFEDRLNRKAAELALDFAGCPSDLYNDYGIAPYRVTPTIPTPPPVAQ